MEFVEGRNRLCLTGSSEAVVAGGRMVFVAGQVGWVENCFLARDLVGQVRQALHNVVVILGEAGARPEHIVRLTWYVGDTAEYKRQLGPIGTVYREIVGRHRPVMTVVQVSGFVEDGALVEIEATAVVPV